MRALAYTVWVVGLLAVIGLRLANPDIPEARLLITFWPVWLVVVVGAALVILSKWR